MSALLGGGAESITFRFGPSKLTKILSPGVDKSDNPRKQPEPDFSPDTEPNEFARRAMDHGNLMEDAAAALIARWAEARSARFVHQDPDARLREYAGDQEKIDKAAENESRAVKYFDELSQKGAPVNEDQMLARAKHNRAHARYRANKLDEKDGEGRKEKQYGCITLVGQTDGRIKGLGLTTVVEIKSPYGGKYMNDPQRNGKPNWGKRKWYKYFIQLAMELFLTDADQVMLVQYIAPSLMSFREGEFPNLTRKTSAEYIMIRKEELKPLHDLIFHFLDEVCKHPETINKCTQDSTQTTALCAKTKIPEIHKKILTELRRLGAEKRWQPLEVAQAAALSPPTTTVASSPPTPMTGGTLVVEGSLWSGAWMSSRPRTNTRIELEPEPSNKFDREAIAVFIDNDLVQYISNKGEENQRRKRFLLQLISEGRITNIKPVYQEAARGVRVRRLEITYDPAEQRGKKRGVDEMSKLLEKLSLKF